MPPPINQQQLPKKKKKIKNRWSPQINKHFGLPPINQPPILKSIFFIQHLLFLILFISNCFLPFF